VGHDPAAGRPAGPDRLASAADELDVLVRSGLDGIYANGTAGEFHNQTDAEYERLVALVAERAQAAGMPFQIGVSCTNARVARERLRALRGLRPSAAQFTLPDWWAPSPPELQAFVAGMQDAADGVPLVLYNPPQAKLRLTLAQIAALRAEFPLLVGAKLPGGDADWYAQRRAQLPGFSVFVPGHTVAFGRPLGADGAYSNVACLGPARRVAALAAECRCTGPRARTRRTHPAVHGPACAAAGAEPRPGAPGAGQDDGRGGRLGPGARAHVVALRQRA
jgi:dihydrodipicolinate synthase/N-acetylneuraminate lyase